MRANGFRVSGCVIGSSCARTGRAEVPSWRFEGLFGMWSGRERARGVFVLLPDRPVWPDAGAGADAANEDKDPWLEAW